RGRWHSGARRVFDRAMAVAAIDAETADMMLMTERHRLQRNERDLRVVMHPRHAPDQERRKAGEPGEGEQHGVGDKVRSWAEDCRHDRRHTLPAAAPIR